MFTRTSDKSPSTNKTERNFKIIISSRYRVFAIIAVMAVAAAIFVVPAKAFNASYVGSSVTVLGMLAEKLGFSTYETDDKNVAAPKSEELVESVQYSQGFEVDGDWSGTIINRVASGSNGITSRTGGHHAEAIENNFTRWGGYSNVFPALGFTTSVDIYLDMACCSVNGRLFAYTSAISDNSPNNHLRDFVFSGGWYNDSDVYGSGPRYVVSASNNAPGNPKDPGRDPFTITSTGWYKFKHRFYDNGSGKLAVDMSIVNSAGVVIKSWTLSNPADIISGVGANVGGNRYGWFQTMNQPFLAIDNATRSNIVPPAVVTVRPEAMNGWVTEGADGGAAAFINDATAPAGFGALALTSTSDNNAYAYAYKAVDVPLADVTDMSYYTKKVSGPASANPAFVFEVYLDGTAANSTYMFYEPYWNGTVQTGTWQQWDVAAATQLWSSSTRNAGGSCQVTAGGGGAPFYTLDGIKTACPNAVVKALYLNIGTYNPNYNVQADLLEFNDTVYDFEPSQITYVDDDGSAVLGNCDGAGFAHNTVSAAVAAANPGDTIRVCPGTFAPAATVNLNKAGLTIIGAEATKPVLETTGTAHTFLVTAAGVTLDNLEIKKTDPGITSAAHNLIGVQASNFTAQNNLIYGPNPGTPWGVNNILSRAFEVSGGHSGITIQNNTIHTLRQPGYLNSSSGTIANNVVYGTRGWVVDSGSTIWNFSGNSWGSVENEACDIALIASTNLANYSPLLALSTNNSNAFICASGIGGENGRSTAYVNNAAPLGGSSLDPYSTIQAGIDGALTGGTVQVAAGTYVEQISINKTLNILGPNANINPNTGVRVAEAIIQPSSSDPLNIPNGPVVVDISKPGVVFNGFTVDGDNPALTSGVVYNGADVDAAYGVTGGGGGTADAQATVTNNIVKNIGEIGVYLYDWGYNGAHTPSTFQYNKVDNVPGHIYGIGTIFSYNAYTNVLDNVVTRAGIGIVTENINQPNSGAATSIANNSVTAHSYGIRVNTQSGYTSNGWTVTNNNVTSYVESYARPTPVTRFNGIRLESLQGTIPLTVSNNTITPDRTALVGNGYTRVEGIYLTNTSTVTPNILITQNTISNALRAISQTTPAVPTVTCNLLINNDTGVYVGTDLGFGGVPSSSTNGININDNNIVNNTSFGVQNDSAFVTNAENNFWGSASGPGGAGPGTGDDVSSNVDFSPFAAVPNACAGLPPAVSISGTVSPALAGVTINLSGDQVGSTVTDGAGNYSFTGLTSGGNYLVTPSLAGYNFDPTNRSYSNLTTNVTNANFTRYTGGSPRLISVVSQNVVPGQQVVVPITVLSQGNENSFGFSLNYDTAYLSNPIVSLGADCLDCFLTVNSVGSTIGIVIAKPSNQTLALSPPARQLVTVTFNTTSTPASFSTPVTFGDLPVVRSVADANADPLHASYASGTVSFATGFESDVAPRFTGSNTGIINSGDVTMTARFVAGLETSNPLFNEFQRVDSAPRATKGSGSINAGDLTQAARYAAGLDPVQSAGGPVVANLFDPVAAAKKYSSENLVVGTVRTLKAVDTDTSRGAQVLVSFEIEAQGDENSVGFTVSYDQSVLTNPVVSVGSGMPGFLTPNTTTNPGRVGVVNLLPVETTLPAGTRQVVTIRFDVSVTAPFGQTPLALVSHPPTENFISDIFGSELPTVFSTGFVNVLAPTAASVSVGGQVTTDGGRDLGNVRLTLTDSHGVVRSAISNAFGFYRFDDVIVGQTYVISATRKGYMFQPQAVTINDQVTNLNIIADR